MKKLIFILILIFTVVGCDNDPHVSPEAVAEPTELDSIQNYTGSFISAGNQAVLKGDKFIYQIKMDSVANSLKKELVNYKENNASVLPVEVKGKVTDNPEPEGYSQIIEIKEIVEIFAKRESETTELKN